MTILTGGLALLSLMGVLLVAGGGIILMLGIPRTWNVEVLFMSGICVFSGMALLMTLAFVG